MTTDPPRWTIEFRTHARGKSKVIEFINGLPVEDQTKVRKDLRLLGLFGVGLGMPYAKALSGHKPLWELRPGKIRLIYFAHTDRRLVILHAFRKKSPRIPRREIATAERRMAAFLEGEK